jgi:hypothetical protein
MPFTVDVEQVKAAIKVADALGKSYKNKSK